MSDERFDIRVDSTRKRLERLSQLAGDLPPSHQVLVQEALEALSDSVEQLQMAAQERARLLDQIQRDQVSLAELAKSLEREREILQTLLQHTDAHLAYLDTDFNFVRVNATYARGSGYRIEDLIGRNHFELFPHAENQAIFEQVRESGVPIHFRAKPFEYPDQPERGVTYWDWTLMPVKDEDDQLLGLVLSLLDVTEDVKAEQALRDERDKAQSYLDIAGAIIVAMGTDQVVTLINRKGCEILGYEEKDIVGKNWLDTFIPEGERERIRTAFGLLIAGKINIFEHFETPVLTSSGEERLVAWHNALLRDDRGQIIGTLSSGEDITERRRSEVALQELAYDRGERVKELDCLHAISDLVEVPGISLEEITKGTVDLLPPAWQYPEVTCARITLEGHEFSTENFAPSPWQLAAYISAHGEEIGTVQVGYLQERPASDEGPFLNEKKELLNTIARRLGRITERLQAQQKLLQQHQFMQHVLDSLPHPFYVINSQDRTVEMANAAALAGRSQDKRTCFALVHGREQPCDMQEDVCPLHEVVRTRKPVVVEHVHTDQDGCEQNVEVHGYPITDPENNVIQMIEYTLDITERKRAEQALRESEARWRSLTETSPDHILTLDTDLNIQFANFASPGLTVDELIGTPLHTLVGEAAQTEVRSILENALQGRTPATYETVYHTPDGEDIYYESRVAARMLSGSEDIIGLTVSARDITDRKRTERALRDSEERLRALFEIVPVGISVLDESSRIRFANPALGRILRLSQEQLLSGEHEKRSYLRADGTEMPPEEFPSKRAVREQRLVRDVERCVVMEDGDQVWTSVSAVPLPSADWRVIVTTIDITDQKIATAALSRARDELELRVAQRTAELRDLNMSLCAEIAERQRAEEQLRASEERFRQLAENTEDIILLAQPDDGRLLYVSPAYEKFLARSSRSVPERMDHLWADVHPDDLELIPQGGVEAWLGKDIEFRVIAPDDRLRWIQARAFPVHDEEGRIYRVVGIASDITEQKEAYAAVIEAERLAVAGRMAASLAHEINNPLQAAIGCLDLSLEQLNQGKDPHQHLQVTADALDRASRVVAQLRALHYPADVERKEASDLNTLLENMLVLVQKRCLDQQVEVHWLPAADLPTVVLMPGAIQQVFLNLLLNALDAMPYGGRLQVSTSASMDPTGILIRFSDSGYGIPGDGLKRVFEPFYSTKPNSLGLGLFISHNIVQEHGGQIEVDSQEGEGTTFSIWLPISSHGSS